MDNDFINKLLLRPSSWLVNKDQDEDIIISSRIRLARNLTGMNFPVTSSKASANQVVTAITTAISRIDSLGKIFEFDICALSEVDRQFLLERHLISREFYVGNPDSCLIVDEHETFGLMVNEEDHIRAQILRPGMSLREIWKEISSIENKLGEKLPFAFSPTLGYLTSCLVNVGTGMKASVMLNLPALVLSGLIHSVIQGISKLGLAVTGLYGEGSAALGNLYQISNQSTLGESEEQIISKISNVIQQVANHERNARLKMIETKKHLLFDIIGRAYGILNHSYILSTKEALDSLSVLRMGVTLKMFQSLNMQILNELFMTTQPAHLQKYAGKQLTHSERDILRAEIVKNKLQNKV